MGSSASSPVSLTPTFQRMNSYELKHAKRMLQDYKDKDLDFGLDAQALSELLAGDKEWAAEAIDAFGSTNGIVNALAFICGVCIVCPGSALEKAGLVFDALDFDATEQLSMDEMMFILMYALIQLSFPKTIVFLCATRGFCVLSGVGVVPCDDDLESVTLRAYRELNKSSTQSISKAEFTKWVLRFASAGSGSGGDMSRAGSEVMIQSALEQFGVVSAPKESSPAHEDELKGASEAGADNNELAPDQGENDQQMDAELRDDESSAVDASYQAHGDNEANADEEKNYFTEAASAAELEASLEKETVVASELEAQLEEATYADKAAPDHEQSFEAPPIASTDEQEGHRVLGLEPEETQEYEQEFAPETPRNADSMVAVEQIQDEEQAAAEANDISAEADPQVDRSPSPQPSSDEPLASSEPQPETDLIAPEAEVADGSPPVDSISEISDELVPEDADKHEEEVTRPSDEASEPEAVAGVVSAHEVDADYENDDYDPPSACEDEDGAAESAAIETVDASAEPETGEPSSAEQEHDEATPEGVSEPCAAAGAGDVDLNDFEAYDYEQPEFDASSGLPPPEDLADYVDDPLADEAIGDEEALAADDMPPGADEGAGVDGATADQITAATEEVSVADDTLVVDDDAPGDNVVAATNKVPAVAEDEPPANEEEENETTTVIAIRSAAEGPATEGASAAPQEQQSEEV